MQSLDSNFTNKHTLSNPKPRLYVLIVVCQHNTNWSSNTLVPNVLEPNSIYIIIAHNIKILFFLCEILMSYNLWNCCKNYLLKVCSHAPMLVNSTYWVISPPFISHYRYIRGIFGVEIFGRQQLQTILWNWGFYYYFMALDIVLKNYFEDVLNLVN